MVDGWLIANQALRSASSRSGQQGSAFVRTPRHARSEPAPCWRGSVPHGGVERWWHDRSQLHRSPCTRSVTRRRGAPILANPWSWSAARTSSSRRGRGRRNPVFARFSNLPATRNATYAKTANDNNGKWRIANPLVVSNAPTCDAPRALDDVGKRGRVGTCSYPSISRSQGPLWVRERWRRFASWTISARYDLLPPWLRISRTATRGFRLQTPQ